MKPSGSVSVTEPRSSVLAQCDGDRYFVLRRHRGRGKTPGSAVSGRRWNLGQGGEDAGCRILGNPGAPGVNMVGEPVDGCFISRSFRVGIHPPGGIPQVDIHIKVPLFKKVHHVGRQFRQAGMGPDQDGGIFVGTGPVGGPAFVGVGRFFQPHQVQQQGRVVGLPTGNPTRDLSFS